MYYISLHKKVPPPRVEHLSREEIKIIKKKGALKRYCAFHQKNNVPAVRARGRRHFSA